MDDWSLRHPERLAWELEQFAARGLGVRIERTSSGRIHMYTSLGHEGQPPEIRLEFPRHFPDAPPKLYSDESLMRRHQHAAGGNLCLGDDADWWPTRCAAELIDPELRRLLADTAVGPQQVAAREADMPEPLSAHFATDTSVAVVVPDPMWTPGSKESGRLSLVPWARANLLLVTAADGLGTIDETLMGRIVTGTPARQHGYWVHLDVPPAPDGDALLGRCLRELREVGSELRHLERKRRSASMWIGARFSEEGPKRGESRYAWIFVDVGLEHGKPVGRRIVRAQALTQGERGRRVPELAGLSRATVVLVGAGSLGAPLGLELARAGVGHMSIYDDDTYDVNNAVRHLLPLVYAGMPKAQGLQMLGQSVNPFVEIDYHHVTVGRESDELAVAMARAIEQADVVVDTTGVASVARLLQGYAGMAGISLVSGGLTGGSFGADLLISRPAGPCRDCLTLAQVDGRVPLPLAGKQSTLTPVACSHPAFIGAGFEATELAAVMARAVVGLVPDLEYPGPDFDWMVLNFRREPARQQGRLGVHPDCPRH